MNNHPVYALDFDGVICDSAMETGISGWKAACQIWSDMPADVCQKSVGLFRHIRPVIETGYEAVLAMRMLYLGTEVDSVFASYGEAFRSLMAEARVSADDLKQLFGDTRDAWIASDKMEWVCKNPLYTDVATRLSDISKSGDWFIVTTKQERFVKMILRANQIELPDDRIFGLDRKMNKVEVLKVLRKRHLGQPIRFVEDRVQTLIKIAQEPELSDVELYFALWGYNTDDDKRTARTHRFKQLLLEEFLI